MKKLFCLMILSALLALSLISCSFTDAIYGNIAQQFSEFAEHREARDQKENVNDSEQKYSFLERIQSMTDLPSSTEDIVPMKEVFDASEKCRIESCKNPKMAGEIFCVEHTYTYSDNYNEITITGYTGEYSAQSVRSNHRFCAWIPPEPCTDSAKIVHGFRAAAY